MAFPENAIVFSAIKVNADNTKLEVDAHGYYKVTLGAFNVINSSGEFYTAEGIEDLINNQSSILARRLKGGYLKGELGHPSMTPGMTIADFYVRNQEIEMKNTAFHIRDIAFIPTNTPSEIPGEGNIVRIEAWIKPSGPYGDALKKALDNEDENVAFSIRCFTANREVNGKTYKKVMQIVTWDWVLAPGIKKANKFDTLSIECAEYATISPELLGSTTSINSCISCALESDDARVATIELITACSKNITISDMFKGWGRN
jgi:hypothetical protein